MGRVRVVLGLGVRYRGVMDCYIRAHICSALNTRVMRNTSGPSSLHDPERQ